MLNGQLSTTLHQIEMLLTCSALMFALMLTLLASGLRSTPIRVHSEQPQLDDELSPEEQSMFRDREEEV